MPPPLFDRVPRWMVVYGFLMLLAAVGNLIGGVPETVSWQLLIGGAVALVPAISRYLNEEERPARLPSSGPQRPLAGRDRVRALPRGEDEEL